MRLTNKFALFGLALLMSVSVQASRLQQDFSDYGIDTPSPINVSCLAEDGSVLLSSPPCAVMTAEDYVDSSLGTLHIFDFKVDEAISNFTLTLTGSESFISDLNVNGPFGYGAFLCNGLPGDPRQCGPDPTDVPTTVELVDSQTVKFHVAGPNNSFVFFAILPEPVVDAPTNLMVTAKLTLDTSEVPEPSTLPILLLGGGVVMAAFKRRTGKPAA